jgi:multiple sugar transport system permease protein
LNAVVNVRKVLLCDIRAPLRNHVTQIAVSQSRGAVQPNVAPAVAATAVYVFIVAWDDFLFARTLLTGGASTTITVGAASYLGEVTVHWNRLMALAALATAPCLLFFLALSTQLTRSIGSDVY